jgi:cytochrome c-type biogenesis protein CcmH/NrfG
LLARISTSPAEAARAAEALHAALKTRKEDAELWHLLGEAFLRSGRADEAASALEEAWRLAPDNSLTTHRLAEALERTNQSARAVKLRQAARQLNPAPNPPLVYKARK